MISWISSFYVHVYKLFLFLLTLIFVVGLNHEIQENSCPMKHNVITVMKSAEWSTGNNNSTLSLYYLQINSCHLSLNFYFFIQPLCLKKSLNIVQNALLTSKKLSAVGSWGHELWSFLKKIPLVRWMTMFDMALS